MKIAAVTFAAVAVAAASEITIENFATPVHSWRLQNDPVSARSRAMAHASTEC